VSATDVTGPLARIVNRIESVVGIGLVHDHDIYDRDDLAELLQSSIDGEPTLRAWWIRGPQLVSSQRLTQIATGYLERQWSYTIVGVEGLSANGDSVRTLRANALALMDAIDADWSLNNTCHRTLGCTITEGPDNRVVGSAGIGVSYIEIVKPVVTISTP
jgi:hypothetical protein